METLRRALGNSALMLMSQAITWISTLVLTGALGSHLGDAGFGNLYLAMSFAAIAGLLVDFGLNEQLVREIARDRELAGRYLVNAVSIKIGLAVAAYLLTLAIARVLGYPSELRLVIAIFCLILLVNALGATLAALGRGIEYVLPASTALIVEKVFVTAVAIALLYRGYGIASVAAVFVAGALLNTTWQAFHLRRRIAFSGTVERRTMGLLVKGALPFLAYWVLGAVYYRVDIVLLSKLSTPAVVGWYSAAYRLFDTLFFLPGIVSGAVLLPILSRMSTVSRGQLRLAIGKGLDTLLLLGVPICTGLFVLAEPILQFIYRRPEFLNAAPALRWLAIALILVYANSVLATVLISINREGKLALIPGFATVVNVVLNLLLIPRYHHLAAAAVTTATECIIFGSLLLCLPADLRPRRSLLVLAKAMGASLAMVLALYMLQGQSLPVSIVLGGLVYCLAALALRLVPLQDLRLLRSALTRRGGVGHAETMGD
jgi:O-antigen/teichoic acid export membrane protein